MSASLRRVALSAALAALALSAPVAQAQRDPIGPDRGGPPRRAEMEQQLRRNLWQIAQRRLALSETQMTQLAQTSRRFDERRRALGTEERSQRITLRQELMADSAADQDRVAKALDRLHELQRQRVDLQIEEQREFATFMTPVQRAKYAALQEHLRRRVEALRRQRPDGGFGPPP
ncbi:MAG TPA: hypothetical protein VM033_02390 [Gemmatimonadaceae bacterium]|nr:hypothetical protein [Gemmatimonadaceae bacterium]